MESVAKYDNSLFFPILIAVILIVLTAVFYLYFKQKVVRNGILLLGLCESGKTLLFARLCLDKFVDTHTSIQVNESELVTSKSTLKIIDIPGHERLRKKYFDSYKNCAKGLIFIIDSNSIQKDIRDVAEYLYTVLTDASVLKARPNILIVCNKQDQENAKGSIFVRKILETELDTLRLTKASRLESTDGIDSKEERYLGVKGEKFEFKHMEPIEIHFVETTLAVNDSSNDSEINLDNVNNWLSKL